MTLATDLSGGRPIAHPGAWQASDYPTADSLSTSLSATEIDAVQTLGREVRGRSESPEAVDPGGLDFAGLGERGLRWRQEVIDGSGFLLLRGLPESMSDEDYTAVFWALGGLFGPAVSQSNMGDRIGHVVNVGGDDFRERAYRNRRELSMHTDRCDVVGMMCLQPAFEGGLSSYASALALYNHIAKTRPELVEPLTRGFYYHRFGEQASNEPGITRARVPIISAADNAVSVVYLRAYIEMAAKENDQPLTEREREALDVFDALANSDEFKVNMMLGRGDIVFFNNCTMLHKRSAFEDKPEEAPRRHLLRLWLMTPDRPRIDALRAYKRDGIEVKTGGNTYYRGASLVTPDQYTRSGEDAG
ncbi:MAG: TauD/TfdA family dioxygenase [Pseudomonadota bacterium]